MEINPENIKLPDGLEGRQFLTAAEFGGLLGMSGATINRWIKLGIVRARQFTPRCRMIPIDEVERLKTEGLMEPP